MSAPEAEVQARILRECGSLPGVRLFRNAVGEGWTGKVVQHEAGLLTLAGARRVTFGWCHGSSDLLGWQSIIVTSEMVGRPIARLVAIEVKADRGRASEIQERFLAVVERAGGVSTVARSPADVLTALDDRSLFSGCVT